jgi:hypothetical protein
MMCIASTAVAQRAGDAIVLAWDAPAECPAQADVLAEVNRLLGGAPDPTGRKRLGAKANVERDPKGGFRVHLTTDMAGVSGERDLDAPTCPALADATALVLALTFDPEAVAARRAEARKEPTPERSAAPVRAAGPPTSPSSRPAAAADSSTGSEAGRERNWHVVIGAEMNGSLGPLPTLAYGLGGRIGILVRRARFDAGATYWPDQRATVGDRDSGGDFRLFAGNADGCYAVIVRPVELSPCVGIELGRMSAEGYGVKRPDSGAATWFAPWAGALGALSIASPVRARIDLGIEVPLLRPPFYLQGVGSVHRASAIAARGGIGIELAL